jgi:ribosome biogenesis GTPase
MSTLVFDDVLTLAENCRFADCTHQTEPGCAVLEAIETGRLNAERLEHYQRLEREAEFELLKGDKALAANRKKRWKKLSQAQKALYRNRERRE